MSERTTAGEIAAAFAEARPVFEDASGDVLPRRAADDAPDQGRIDTVLKGQIAMSNTALSVQRANGHHIRLGQLRVRLPLPKDRAPRDAVLRDGVLHVVGPCAGEQMSRVHTRGIVTVVAQVQCWINWAMRKLPCHMGGYPLAPVHNELPIATAIFRALPLPAIVRGGNVDLGPEAFGECPVLSSGPTGPATEPATACDLPRFRMECDAAVSAGQFDSGRLGTHFWSLLNRFRGAVPRAVPAAPRFSLCLNYTGIPGGMGSL